MHLVLSERCRWLDTGGRASLSTFTFHFLAFLLAFLTLSFHWYKVVSGLVGKRESSRHRVLLACVIRRVLACVSRCVPRAVPPRSLAFRVHMRVGERESSRHTVLLACVIRRVLACVARHYYIGRHKGATGLYTLFYIGTSASTCSASTPQAMVHSYTLLTVMRCVTHRGMCPVCIHPWLCPGRA